MRVLFITKRFYTNRDLIGDRYGRLFHLPIQLGARGHDVRVIALDYRGGRGDDLILERARFESVPFHGFMALRSLRTLEARVESERPDVIIASADTPLGLLGRRLARRAKALFVFDVYDNYGTFASARVPGMTRAFESVVESADLVLVVSRALADLTEARARDLAIVPNGVDPVVFRPIDRATVRSRLGIDPSERVIGYFGSIEAERGIETMIDAVERLNAPDAVGVHRLLMAGHDQLGVTGAAPWIDHRGVVTQSEVAQMINACDVVVLPYLDDDWGRYTFPNKLAEYVACGVPIVATSIPQFADITGSGYQGLCTPGDAHAMSCAIEAQLLSPDAVGISLAPTWAALGEVLEHAIVSVRERRAPK